MTEKASGDRLAGPECISRGSAKIVMEEGSCMYQEPGIKHSVLEYEEPRAAESFHAAMTTTRPRHRVVNQGAEQ
jgi:hypothetical protein